jgi:hypothetical protein
LIGLSPRKFRRVRFRMEAIEEASVRNNLAEGRVTSRYGRCVKGANWCDSTLVELALMLQLVHNDHRAPIPVASLQAAAAGSAARSRSWRMH